MPSLGLPELVIVLVIVVLLFLWWRDFQEMILQL